MIGELLFRRVLHAEDHFAGQSCYLTGAVDDLVDTSVFIEGEGVLALSVQAIKELAIAAGFSVNDDRSHEINVLRARVQLLEDQLREERVVIREMVETAKRVRADQRADAAARRGAREAAAESAE